MKVPRTVILKAIKITLKEKEKYSIKDIMNYIEINHGMKIRRKDVVAVIVDIIQESIQKEYE